MRSVVHSEIGQCPDNVLDRFLVRFEADLLMVGALVPMLEPVPGFIQMLLGNDFLGDIEPAGEDRLELSKRSPITDGLSRISSAAPASVIAGRYAW